MPRPDYTVGHFGDAALLVSFEQRIDPLVNAHVHAAAERLHAARTAEPAWSMPVPGYASLVTAYDPLRLPAGAALDALERLLDEVVWPTTPPSTGTLVEIPVCYGGDDGPDLAAVAELTGMTPAQVVELHSSVIYRAYLLGFAPGFAYLGELPAELEVPRLGTPRPRVPAGSVAIAARQTAVYPMATPGGWQLIGRTDAVVWDARRDPPALITAGAGVRFVPSA